MTQQRASMRVGYDVDKSSINAVVAGNAAVRQSVEGVKDVLGDLGPATTAAVNMLMTRFDALGRNIEDDRRIVSDLYGDLKALDGVVVEPEVKTRIEDDQRMVEDLRAELLALDDVVVEPEVRVKQTGGQERNRREVGGLETADRFGTVASQILGGVGAGELGGIANLIGDVAGGVSSLGTLGVATAALAPIIGAVTSKVDENAKREAARAEVLGKVADIITNGTRRQVEAQIQALGLENAAREAQIQSIEKQTGRSRDYLENLTRVDFNDFGVLGTISTAIDTFGGLGAQGAAVAQANQQIEANIFFMEQLRAVLEGNGTATNDYSAGVLRDTELILAADQMTEAQRNERINGINREIQILQMVTADSNLSADAAKQLNNQIADLTYEAELLGDQSNTTADAIARQTEAARQLAAEQSAWDNIIGANVSALLAGERMTEGQRRQRVGEINNEIEVLTRASQSTRISAEYADQLRQRIAALGAEKLTLQSITESLADKMAEGAEKARRLKEATELILDANEQYAKAQEKLFTATKALNEESEEAGRKLQKLVAETEGKRAEILAAAADKQIELEQKRVDEIEKIERDFTRSLTGAVGERDALAGKRAEESRTDQLADQIKGNERARAELEKNLRGQLNDLQQGYAQQQQALLEQINRELGIKRQNYQQALLEVQNALAAQAAAQRYYIGVAYDVGLAQAQAFTQGLMAGSPAAYDFTGMNRFNSPTPLPAPLPGGGTQGATTININGTGMSAAQLRGVIQSAAGRSGGNGI